MRNQAFETIIGLAVLVVGVGFLFFAIDRTDIGSVEGYNVSADFSRVDGISSGSDVRISGVKVGTVTDLHLDPTTFLARISFNIDPGVELPADTLAKIESEGLLGGQYLALEPGAEDDLLRDGDQIAYTQSSPSLSELLGQAVFSGGEN
ncbi:MAG: outer membrane lipid asymmetry maintenance protein MlaD [Pseudomonadota bacterium]